MPVTGGASEAPQGPAVLERMTDAFFGLDDEWRFTYLNEQAGELIDVDPDAVHGERIWDEFPEAVGTQFEYEYRAAMLTQEPVSFDSYYPPLETWFEVNAYPAPDGLSVYFRDISERKRREAQQERDREALQSLYRIAADSERSFDEKVDAVLELGCTYLDVPFGMVNELDESGQTIAYAYGTPDGLQPGATMPRDEAYCKETIRTDDLLAIVDAVEEGWGDDPAYREHGLGCYIGGRIEIDDDVDRTLCFAGYEPRESSFTATEETVVELLTQWLTFEFTRRADRATLERKNERLENLASVVSHDLMNPLTIAQARIDFIADNLQNEHVDAVTNSLDRIESLVDDLTTLARQGDVIDEPTAVSLSTVVGDAWEAVPTKDATLDREGDHVLYADESRLQQVLENLFNNSVEHGGADVTVTVTATEEGFAVTDDGPGIPPDEREDVLRMGYTTASDGSGIGMAIVREVVEAHGWSVEVGESASGGARFEVTGVEPVE
jgi:signal transduction histidine kinase